MQLTEVQKNLLIGSISNVALMSALGNSLLNSDYYKTEMTWPWDGTAHAGNSIIVKEYIDKATLGNPIMLLMHLYVLLVLPKELIGPAYTNFCKNDFNDFLSQLSVDHNSTYADDNNGIKYFRHIRNSVAHSKFEFIRDNGTDYIIFNDSNNNGETFNAKIAYSDVGKIIDHLCGLMMSFFNQNK